MDAAGNWPLSTLSMNTLISATWLAEFPWATICSGALENVASCGWHTVIELLTALFRHGARGVAFRNTSIVLLVEVTVAKSILPSRLKSPAINLVLTGAVVRMNRTGVARIVCPAPPRHRITPLPTVSLSPADVLTFRPGL